VRGPLDYSTLRAAWESSVIVKEHGRLVAKTITQAERRAYRDDLSSARPARFRDDRSWRRASAKSRKDSVDRVCVRRMRYLLERNETRSVPVAAARVAVEFWISGPSFEAVVRRLSRAYHRAFKGLDEARTNRRRTEKVGPVRQKVRKYRCS
jgi:hypothetical protein